MNQQQRPDREQLLQWISMVSFACTDSALYLNTHPDCSEALAYHHKHMALRKQALEEYARLYGPLTMDSAVSNSNNWMWIQQPWPWEGGKC